MYKIKNTELDFESRIFHLHKIFYSAKLRFSNGDIANMLAISPTSVSKRKLRLKERIVQEIGSLGENQSLDLWLMEY